MFKIPLKNIHFTIIKYLLIAIVSISLFSCSVDIMPGFVKDRLPFVGRQDYLKIKKDNDILLKSLKIKEFKIDSLNVVISKRDSIENILNKKSETFTEKINQNKIKIEKSSLVELDSLLEDCECF